jgi:hypothetical protein
VKTEEGRISWFAGGLAPSTRRARRWRSYFRPPPSSPGRVQDSKSPTRRLGLGRLGRAASRPQPCREPAAESRSLAGEGCRRGIARPAARRRSPTARVAESRSQRRAAAQATRDATRGMEGGVGALDGWRKEGRQPLLFCWAKNILGSTRTKARA